MLFVAATVVLIVVVCFQAAMLHSKGWRTPLGTLPEWITAFGVVAAFLTLWVAARGFQSAEKERQSLEEERQALAATREAERRDHVISQARLIIVEHAPHVPLAWGGQDPPAPGRRDVLIRNHSDAPIFNLHIEGHPTGNDDVLLSQNFATGRSRPADMAVLAADQATELLIVEGSDADTPSTEYVEFTFTDARGARWRRLGSQQPIQEL
jgi:hypothetical protein